MANNNLQGKKIAILVADGFEQVELLEPRKALDAAGATTQVVSPADKKVKGWNMKDWGDEVTVDVPLKAANPAEFDALLLPGGVMNPDHLRMNPEAVKFVKHSRSKASRSPRSATDRGRWSRQMPYAART